MDDCRLILGDCLDVLPTLEAGSIDAVITDPPYSSGGMYRHDRVTLTTDEKYTYEENRGRRPDFFGDNMDQWSWRNWCRMWLAAALRVTRDGGYVISFTDWRQLPALTDAVQHAGWIWRGVLTWDKGDGTKGPHTGYFAYQCEFLVWATKGRCLRRPNLTEGGDGRLPGCYRQHVLQSDKHHQTGKPTPVMHWLVRCCPPGGTVLDPFMGSGTTGVACLQSNRKFVGIEKGTGYFGLAQRRLAEVNGPLFALAAGRGTDLFGSEVR